MVFGGIIHHVGTLEVLSRLKIRVNVPSELSAAAQLGDSIAINGVCLTVVDKTDSSFEFDLSEETLIRTALASAPKQVHVESALKLSDAVGGHVISGHVHGVGFMKSLDVKTGEMVIHLPRATFPCRPIYKDSIAVDGVSLTVAEVTSDDCIRIALIPHTLKLTLFASLAADTPVNIELNAATLASHAVSSPILLSKPTSTADPGVTSPSQDDIAFMKQAIEEGEKGRFTAPPNPWVGAVLVNPWGTVIARGHHVRPGEAHAERMIEAPMTSCTLYVTLEPCCHYGRTPPCVEYLVERRPARVVIGTLDPDPRVRGKGVAVLRSAGIDVTVGVAEDAVRFSLRAYLWHRNHDNRPYIVCKLALSQDNCFAYKSDCVEKRSWITGQEARKHGHGERAGSQLLVVGKQTAIMDKPQLTVRYGYEVDKQPEAIVSTRDLLWVKSDANVLQALVEGGPELEEDLLRRGIVNEYVLYRSTKLLGLNGVRWLPSYAHHDWQLVETKTFDDGDTMQRFLLHTSASPVNADGGGRNNGDEIAEDPNAIRFDTLRTAISALQRGDLIIVMDDANRENEGDLMMLADRITMRNMKFLLAHTTGIVCATMSQTRANQLNLPLMVNQDRNTDPHRTKFTVSVDAASGVTTGVCAADRIKTLSLLASPDANSRDFNRPGHIFPLVAAPGGLLQRRGHTEAGVELARLAGMPTPVMVISELYDSATGKMMSRAQCRQLGFPMISIDTILGGHASPLWASVPLQHHSGDWRLSIIAAHKVVMLPSNNSDDGGDVARMKDIVLRIHSECFTGDVLGSSLCDCGNQLHAALEYIATNPPGGGGLVIFPPEHEGRGIGLSEKVKVYALQREQHLDTFAANASRGHPEDARDFSGVVFVLQHLGIRPESHRITLLTENPAKVQALSRAGYNVTALALMVKDTQHNAKYLADKREYFTNSGARLASPVNMGLCSPSTTKPSTASEPTVGPASLMKQAPKVLQLTPEEREYVSTWSVCIVQAEWHRHVSDILVDNIAHHLRVEYGIKDLSREFAPGSFELPRVVQHLSRTRYRSPRVVFIAVGILVKGDTDHYDLVSRETTANLLRLQLDESLWLVNSVLGCHTMAQVEERCLPQSEKCVGPHMAHAVARLALVARR